MLKKLPLLFLVPIMALFSTATVVAQSTNVDSLENVLQKYATDDSVKVKLLNDIALKVYKKDEKKARSYTKQAMEIATAINFRKGIAQTLFTEGYIASHYQSDKISLEYFLKALPIAEEINYKSGVVGCLIAAGSKYANTGNISEAFDSYNRAEKMCLEMNDTANLIRCVVNRCILHTGKGNYDLAIEDYMRIVPMSKQRNDQKGLSIIYNNLGSIEEYKGNFPKALEHYINSLNIREQINDRLGIIYALGNVGNIHRELLNFEKALEYQHNALKIAEELNDKRMIALCYEYIGEVYMKKNDPQALEFFGKALVIAEELYYTTAILNVSKKTGDFYRNQGNNHKALEYFRKALPFAEEMKRKRVICEIGYKTGAIHLQQKEYSAALTISLKSLDIANEMNLLTFQRDIHHQLSEIYAATNNYTKAFNNHKKYKELSDSVDKEANVKKIIELEYTYKFEKEKQAIELEQQKKDIIQQAQRKQQRIAIVSLLAGLVLISIFAAYVFRSYKAKHRTNLILTKQKAEIEELNEEYLALNEELMQSNEQLHNAKEVIEERENLLTQITDNVPVFISLVNNNFEYEFANNGYARIFNTNQDEIRGRQVNSVLEKESYDTAFPHLLRSMEGEIQSFENTLSYRDGQHRIIHTNYKPYTFRDGIQGVLVCSSDITERKKNEKALREMEEEKKRLMERDMERMNAELETNQKSMAAATLKLIQNSERDTKTIEQLEEIEKNTNTEAKRAINSLISEYKRASYNSNWDEFEILFEKVHSSFYENLSLRFPDLTANERKMCAFMKLNMSSKDIAQITFQSDDALKKARLRLRQKLGIDRETNLAAFMQGI